MKKCQCGKEFDDDPLFQTCPTCRRPHKPTKRRRRGNGRGNPPNKEPRWNESGSSFDNTIRASEEDR